MSAPKVLHASMVLLPALLAGALAWWYLREGTASLRNVIHWSPFDGVTFSSSIDTTIVNGHIIYQNGKLSGDIVGQRLQFDRGR